MRVLVLSNTPWAKDNSFGDSYSNIFSGIPNLEFANIYCRFGVPSGEFVSKSFQITEKSLLKNLKNKKNPSGVEVFVQDGCAKADLEKMPAMEIGQKKRWMLMFWARDMIWKLGRWKSKALLDFIDDFKPDLIFQPIYYSNYLMEIARFIKEYTKVPMIGYVSDDVYTLKQFSLSPLYWLDRLHKRKKVRRVIEQCKLLYVISDMQKREYEQLFSVPCKVLTKSADFSEPPKLKTSYASPMQIVYTGNIGTNRWKSLAMIAEALQNINANGVSAQLRIYTATPLTGKMQAALNVPNTSFLMGAVPPSEIPKIQSEADMLVHVEGLDLQSKLVVRQSFSTKIIDYFKAARPILVVGPHDIASVEHFIRNECAVTAESVAELTEKLRAVLQEPQKLTALAEKAYICGQMHHDKTAMQAMLFRDLAEAVQAE